MSDFEELSWPDLTSDDYAAIDKICVEGTKVQKGALGIHAEFECDTNDSEKNQNDSHKISQSPFSLFRKRGYFSVTDLVSPAWCEVQYDYGLRQRRFLPVERRPTTFKSEKGKEIEVRKDVALRNDKITRGGQAVHKKLEKEIHKVEVVISVKSVEDAWALRFLDVLVRMTTLKEKGVCREVQVWGIVQNEPIMGIIDELRLEPKKMLTSPKRQKTTISSSHSNPQVETSLDSFFGAPAFSKSLPDSAFIMKILDSKTRKSPGIPSHSDTLPSRLQVMLYHRLLGQLISFEPDLFLDFCARLNMDTKKKFSDVFVNEMSAFVIENDLDLNFFDATDLATMLIHFGNSIRDLVRNVELSDDLSLVYRRRGKTHLKGPKIDSDAQAKEKPLEPYFVQSAGNPSTLRDAGGTTTTLAQSSRAMIVIELSEDESDEKVANNALKSTDDVPADDVSPVRTPSKRKRRKSQDMIEDVETVTAIVEGNSTETPKSTSCDIIGSKKFKYNEKMLENHLESIMSWWHGKREPQGVDIENVGRCNSCEYRDGCEWREQKALEVKIHSKVNDETIPESS